MELMKHKGLFNPNKLLMGGKV